MLGGLEHQKMSCVHQACLARWGSSLFYNDSNSTWVRIVRKISKVKPLCNIKLKKSNSAILKFFLKQTDLIIRKVLDGNSGLESP